MESDALEYPGQYAVTRTWSQLWLWGFPLPSPPSQPGDRWRVGPDYPEGTSSREKRTEGIISAPAVAGDRLYIGDTLGKLYGVDAITGEEQWQFQAEDGIVASPVAVGDLVAFGDKSGWFLRLEPARWHGNLGASNSRTPFASAPYMRKAASWLEPKTANSTISSSRELLGGITPVNHQLAALS